MNSLVTWLLIALLIPAFKLNAQSGYANIAVGQPMPATSFSNIKFFKKNKASLNDFKGKWLILDFWTEKCSACIRAMPAMNQLQTKFASDVQFLSVAYDCKECRIQSLYEKYRSKFGLTMPVSFDSVIFRQFELTEFPRIIAIDPEGIVRGITVELDEKDVHNLLTKNELYKTVLNIPERIALRKYNDNLPLLIYGNGGEDTAYLFRSVLVKWNSQMPAGSMGMKGSRNFEAIGWDLAALYRLAYFGGTGRWNLNEPDKYGKIWADPLLLIKDSSLFSSDYAKGINIYSYGVYSPGVNRSLSFFQQALRDDLRRYFGFNASVEERDMPYYKLERFNNITVPKSSGKPMERKIYSTQGFEATNITINQLILLVTRYQRLIPVMDNTGIDYNIDITVDCLMDDIVQIRKALQQKGFDLVPDKKKMKVLAIRD